MTTTNIQNPIKSVAVNVCADTPLCQEISPECGLTCSQVGWSLNPSDGWVFAGGVAVIQFFGCIAPPATTPSLSVWIPETFYIRFCCQATNENQEPDPSKWVSEITYFGSQSYGGFAHKYRAFGTLSVSANDKINVSVVVQVLAVVDGVKTWVGYTNFGNIMTETGTRPYPYSGRSYATSQLYNQVTVSESGGKGDIQYYTMGAGLIPWTSTRCDQYCAMYESALNQWYTCFRGVVYSKTNSFVPVAFLLGQNAATCSNSESCGCDQITWTTISPQAGNLVYNPDTLLNDPYFQIVTNESVGSVTQFQRGGYGGIVQVMVKNVNDGSLQFGTLKYGDTTWVWGSTTVEQTTHPKIYKIERDDFYVFLYVLPFPDESILPDCNVTPIAALPVTAAEPRATEPKRFDRRAALGGPRKPCNCGGR